MRLHSTRILDILAHLVYFLKKPFTLRYSLYFRSPLIFVIL